VGGADLAGALRRNARRAEGGVDVAIAKTVSEAANKGNLSELLAGLAIRSELLDATTGASNE